MEEPSPFDVPLIDGKTDQALFPFHFSLEEYRKIVVDDLQKNRQLMAMPNGYFRYLPSMTPQTNVEGLTDRIVDVEYEHDFVWGSSFHPEFLAVLMYNGYIVLGDAEPHLSPTHTYKQQWLLPKLHVERCIVDWSRFKVNKNLMKRSQKFTMTIDRDFEAVIKGCVRQHTDAWLYPILRKVMLDMHKTNDTRLRVKLHSIEIWMRKDDMVLSPKEVAKDNERLANEAKNTAKKTEASTIQKELTDDEATHTDHADDEAGQDGEPCPTESSTTGDEPSDTTTVGTSADPSNQDETPSTSSSTVDKAKKAPAKSKTTTGKKKQPLKKKKVTKISPDEKKRREFELRDDHPSRHPSLSNALGDEYFLVAGELGVTVGSCYVSLTGFRNSYIDHCGTVQLYALGNYLLENGYTMWDLGMAMPYKESLGAVSIPRKVFVEEFRAIRNNMLPEFGDALHQRALEQQKQRQLEEDQRVERENKKIIKIREKKQARQQQLAGEESCHTPPISLPDLLVPQSIPYIGASCRSLLSIKPSEVPKQDYLLNLPTLTTSESAPGPNDDSQAEDQ